MVGLRTSHRIVPTSVGTWIFFTPDCAHFRWDMVFSSDFLLHGNFGDFSFSTTSCLRWRQRPQSSDFTARPCRHLRLRRKLRSLNTSGTSWSSTSSTSRTSTSHVGSTHFESRPEDFIRTSSWTFATRRATSRRSVDFTHMTSRAYFVQPTSFV